MNKIIELLTGNVACEETALASFRLAMIMAMRNGKTDEFEKQLENQSAVRAVVFAPDGATAMVNTVDQWDIGDPNLPENSVALLYFEGMAYPWKSFDMENRIARINNNPRIVAAVILLNTPGGYVHRIDTLANTIKQSPKPIAAYVTGMCASAGQWLSSSCRRVFSASPYDIHGSIGTMMSLIDDKKFWEQMGIEQKDLYATLSTKKNHLSREHEKGNDEPIINLLDYMNDIFHKTISENRGIAVDPENEVFQGMTFFTPDAISAKLCDELATLDKALTWALTEGLKQKSKSFI